MALYATLAAASYTCFESHASEPSKPKHESLTSAVCDRRRPMQTTPAPSLVLRLADRAESRSERFVLPTIRGFFRILLRALTGAYTYSDMTGHALSVVGGGTPSG